MKIDRNPRLELLPQTRLVGKKHRMSYDRNTTSELWKEFMPGISGIVDRLGSDLYSVEVYEDVDYFRSFEPGREFDKWAAVPVSSSSPAPEGMHTLMIPEGRYAVFNFRGKTSEVHAAYRYIYATWLGVTDYQLDCRPHFAVMGPNYKLEDPDSEEEIWIPLMDL
ncbi:MAG: GyrI-like domain-containing protein [Robiginitalea sp.]